MTDKELLLKVRLPERDVDLDGVGTVRVRGLSRAEALRLKGFADDPEGGEVFALAAGMVDPALTEAEVREWQAAAGIDEVNAVVGAVLDLSGLLPPAAGDDQATFRAGPSGTTGVPPGADVGDDGGSAP